MNNYEFWNLNNFSARNAKCKTFESLNLWDDFYISLSRKVFVFFFKFYFYKYWTRYSVFTIIHQTCCCERINVNKLHFRLVTAFLFLRKLCIFNALQMFSLCYVTRFYYSIFGFHPNILKIKLKCPPNWERAVVFFFGKLAKCCIHSRGTMFSWV